MTKTKTEKTGDLVWRNYGLGCWLEFEVDSNGLLRPTGYTGTFESPHEGGKLEVHHINTGEIKLITPL